MSMGGNLGDYTQTDYMAAQAGGIKDWSGNIYTDPEVGWLSALGYDSYLITDFIAHNGQEMSLPVTFPIWKTGLR